MYRGESHEKCEIIEHPPYMKSVGVLKISHDTDDIPPHVSCEATVFCLIPQCVFGVFFLTSPKTHLLAQNI